MGAFRRVEAAQAGPTALGILIPPSRRTFLILRPRSLPFDLLLLRRPEETAFRELSHDEASAAAHQLFKALQASATVEIVTADNGCWLRVGVGSLAFAACERVPGKAYEPLYFPEADGRVVAERLTALLCPTPGIEQELYFNTRHFQA